MAAVIKDRGLSHFLYLNPPWKPRVKGPTLVELQCGENLALCLTDH